VSRINVLVATASPDVKAEVIAESVAARSDMILVGGRCLALPDVDAVPTIRDLPESATGQPWRTPQSCLRGPPWSLR
jgi:hypothetical protein